jgi:hypothetical protein
MGSYVKFFTGGWGKMGKIRKKVRLNLRPNLSRSFFPHPFVTLKQVQGDSIKGREPGNKPEMRQNGLFQRFSRKNV